MKETEIDREQISSVMIIEMAIVMGFASPLVVLLCLCTMLAHLLVFHFSRVRGRACFIDEARPLCSYLVLSLVLSNALTVSYFWDNKKDNEKAAYCVLVGCTGSVIGYLGWLIFERRRRSSSPTGLREPLLNAEEDSDSSYKTAEHPDEEVVSDSHNHFQRGSTSLWSHATAHTHVAHTPKPTVAVDALD